MVARFTFTQRASIALGTVKPLILSLMHHQGITCCVAFDRSSLRRIAPYASVVAPWRLASDTLLMIRTPL
jgi:hypothetical protein